MTDVISVQQGEWLDVISRKQHGAYNVHMVHEEQEMLDYSYRELVANSTVKLSVISGGISSFLE